MTLGTLGESSLSQDAVSRLGHEPHVALFGRVLAGEERVEVARQWLQGQARLTEECVKWQDLGEVYSVCVLCYTIVIYWPYI